MAYKERIAKKHIAKQLDKIIKTGYFINCDFHPAKLTSFGWNPKKDLCGTDVDGISITTNKGCSCSIKYCDPEPITELTALEMLTIYTEQGDRGLAIKYGGYTEQEYDEFVKNWR
jgi:hypothetical protein